jgi:WD40 repeat protein
MDTIDPSSRPHTATPAAAVQDARFDVFLSHSSRDKPAVERIARTLKEAGIEPWFDAWHLTPGGDWQSEMAAGLRASRSCAVFVGEGGLGDWERQELGLALDQAAKNRHFRVFAVLLPGVPEPFDPTHLPPFISTRTWVDFRGGFKERRVFQRLVNAVFGIPVGAEEAPTARPEICPYRGLQTFDEEHAEFFFGRDADVQRLVERLKEKRFLAVLGPSGSGKSSLVRAGLVPAIRRGALPGSDTWRVIVLRPGAEPLTTLAAQLLDLAPELSMQSTVDQLAEDPRTLHLSVARALASGREEEQTLWVVDQFEEVFTLCHDDAQRRAFFGNLLHAAFAPGGKTFVVITMRADFYYKCAAYPELAQGISANQFLAWPVEEWALSEAIEEPARAVGLQLEEGLTDQILSDLKEAPGALPLMEHTLLELWERRRGSMMTLEAYREAGGVAGSLAKRADLIYESLPESERPIARRILLRLTQPGEGTEDTRRRAGFDELVGTSAERDAVEHVVSALTNARLLTTGTDDSSGDRVVDVSHEALIRGWPRLREWLDEDRTGLRTHRRLTEAAQEWDRSGRDPEALYRGVRLAQAGEWAERNAEAMNELEATFLRESVEAQESERRRRRRRVRVAVGALAAGLVVVGALALLMVVQKRLADEQRQLAYSREIAATSLEQLDRDPQLSLILAIKAYETAPTAQAEAAVRRAFVSSHLRKVFAVGQATGEFFHDVSPDGALIATGTPERSIALWDLATGERVAVLEDPAGAEPPGGPEAGPPVASVSFSPNGKLLFSGRGDGPGRIWSIPDGRLVSLLEGAGFAPGGWTPDSRSVLTAAEEGARLWDVATGEVRAEFPYTGSASGRFGFAALSPDGRLVAIGPGFGPARDSRVRVLNASTGRPVAEFEGEPFGPESFSRDGRHLLLQVGGDQVSVIDVASERVIRVFSLGSGVYHATFSPDGTRVFTGQIVGASVWEVPTGQRVELAGHAGAVIMGSFSADGERAVTVSEDGTGRVWDAQTGQALGVLAGHVGMDFATFMPDGRSVVSTGGRELRVWEVGGGESSVLRGHEGPVVSARFSPDGRSLISSGELGGTARVWDLATARETLVLRPPISPGQDLLLFAEFSPDGRLAVTTGLTRGGPPPEAGGPGGPKDPGPTAAPPEQPPTILWDLESGTARTELDPPQDDPLKICSLEGCSALDAAVSPDGKRVATVGDDGLLHVWDAEKATGLESIALATDGPEDPTLRGGVGVDWSPEGTRLIALTGDGVAHLFDTTTFDRIRSFRPREISPGRAEPGRPEFDPDGSRFAVGYPDGTARVWEARSGRLLAELPHAGPVHDVAFSSDGRFLVTASGDAPTIWDLASQRPLGQLFGHDAAVLTVDFSPEGFSVVSSGDDQSVRLWRCEVCAPIDQLLKTARKRVLRDLTPAERARFLETRPRED